MIPHCKSSVATCHTVGFHYITVQYQYITIIQYSILLYNIKKCFTILYNTVQSCRLLYKTKITYFIIQKYTTGYGNFQKGLGKFLFFKLGCIRPPQSQFAPNIFLKTSVCTDVSQHLHKTNRINHFYNKSLRIFF